MKENKAQISAEYLFFAGVMILIIIISAVFIYSEQELNIAMAAARSGVNDGIASSSEAIYPKQTYNDYSKSKSDSNNILNFLSNTEHVNKVKINAIISISQRKKKILK